jgi:uncharacterized protein YyaL (SSP411 family)
VSPRGGERRVAVTGDEDGPFRNRLAGAHSPYLAQHADNPVDWWAWGDAPFDLARDTDRPVFLSIGYAACHWCHVMERESFADPRVAARMNRDFVCIKVDREEHPEVDAFAMEALLELTGDAGWPASLFLSPDRRPLSGGTYHPPVHRYGMPPFIEVLRRTHEAWSGAGRRGLLARADDTVRALQAAAGPLPGVGVAGPRAVRQGLVSLASSADSRSGGWGMGAKFPHPPRLLLLVEEGDGAGPTQAAQAALTAMERGGLHDHVGGGFHRYTVDPDWDVPHFEKMLCDNALLADVFLAAWSRWREPAWLVAACGALEWCLDDLPRGDGAFAASRDADDPMGEGAFYTWTPGEVAAALGPRAPAVCAALGVSASGNMEHGRTVLRRHGAPGLVALARPRLRAARARRPAPARDDKAVVAWNGMLLTSLARAAGLLGEARYRAAAQALATRLLEAPLRRTLAPDAPDAPGAVLDDRAWVTTGLLALHTVDGDPRWLLGASSLGVEMLTCHQDPDTGALLHGPVGAAAVPVARSPLQDGAEPGPAAVALLALQRLVALGDAAIDAADVARALDAACARLPDREDHHPTLLRALARHHRPARTLTLTGAASDPALRALLAVAARRAPRDVTVAVADPTGALAPRFAAFANRGTPGRAQAWLCEGASCRLPVSDPDALAASLAPSG